MFKEMLTKKDVMDVWNAFWAYVERCPQKADFGTIVSFTSFALSVMSAILCEQKITVEPPEALRKASDLKDVFAEYEDFVKETTIRFRELPDSTPLGEQSAEKFRTVLGWARGKGFGLSMKPPTEIM